MQGVRKNGRGTSREIKVKRDSCAGCERKWEGYIAGDKAD